MVMLKLPFESKVLVAMGVQVEGERAGLVEAMR